jgi:hypothetical protein
MKKLLLAAVLFGLAHASHAQLGVGVAYTAQHIANTNTAPLDAAWLNGATFIVQEDFGEPLFQAGFAGRCTLTSGSGVSVRSATFGPRVAVAPPRLRAKLFAELQFGVLDVQPAPGRLRTGHIESTFVVGLDHQIVRHIDWRIVEYAYSGVNFFDSEDARNQISTGLLFHL